MALVKTMNKAKDDIENQTEIWERDAWQQLFLFPTDETMLAEECPDEVHWVPLAAINLLRVTGIPEGIIG